MTEAQTKIEDGGPAFPAADFKAVGDVQIGTTKGGMSLRDWFAGQALTVIDPKSVKEYELIAMFGPHRTGITTEEIAAALAYRVADALLTARKSGGG
jgi:hypothetical protein